MKNEFEVLEDITVIYVNNKGKRDKVFVSTKDLSLVQKFPNNWVVHYSDDKPYIRGRIQKNGKRIIVGIHQWIMGTYGQKGVVVDHRNHDTFDNTHKNLRVADISQNAQNLKSGKPWSKSGGIRGVSWDKNMNKWKAQVTLRGVYHHLGYFEDPEEAGKVAKKARKELMTHAEN